MKQFCLAILLIVSATAFSQDRKIDSSEDSQPTVTLPPDLDRVLRDYEGAWMRKDSQALASLFTEDGLVLSPGSSMVRGRRAIASHYSDAGGPLSLRAIAFFSEGSVGYIIGGFTDRPGRTDRGKFTLTLRRTSSGNWLIVSDMDNGNIHHNDCQDLSRSPR